MALPKLRVKPVPGRRIMLHNAPNRAIEQERDVPYHPHYTRAVARGDLELVKSSKKKPREAAAKGD